MAEGMRPMRGMQQQRLRLARHADCLDDDVAIYIIIILPCALSSVADRQSRHQCRANNHARTDSRVFQSHPPQPVTTENATNADAIAQWLQRVRRTRNFQTMNAGVVVESKRGDDEFMNGFPAALMRLFQTTRKQLGDFFPEPLSVSFLKICRHRGSCVPQSAAVGCRWATMRHSHLQAALFAGSGCNRVCSYACEGHCFSTPFLL
jgi:hypothetical protein